MTTNVRHKSRYIGVSGQHNRWYARIMRNGRTIQLGSFLLEEMAARAYDKAVLELPPNKKGRPPRLNFPQDIPQPQSTTCPH